MNSLHAMQQCLDVLFTLEELAMFHSSRNVLAHQFALASAVACCAVNAAYPVDKSWNAGQGNWSVAGNWFPIGVPGAADAVYLGNLPIATNTWISLTANVTIAELSITDGMRLDTNERSLVVNGPVVLSGQNETPDGYIYSSRIDLSNGVSVVDGKTQALTLEDGGDVRLFDGAALEVNGLFTIGTGSMLRGDGTVRLMGNGARSLILDGKLAPSLAPITLLQLGDGLIDLDGNVAGDSTLNLSSGSKGGATQGSLFIVGTSLADTFDDDLWLGRGNELHMDLNGSWEVGTSSEVRALGSPPPYYGPSVIGGAPVMMRGHLNVSSSESAHLRIDAPTTFPATATIAIGEDDLLQLEGAALIDGAEFQIGPGGDLDFNGATEILDATIVMDGGEPYTALVDFNGPTTWNGSLSLAGIARQNGDVLVAGNTSIAATLFDIDGAFLPDWTVQAGVVINADRVESGGTNIVNSDFVLASTLNSRLTVNLSDPTDEWFLEGDIELNGLGGLIVTRLAGSPLTLSGGVSVNGRVRATCPLKLGSGADVTFATPASELRLDAPGTVEAGASFMGNGRVITSSAAPLTLDGGVSLGAVGLTVAAPLTVGIGPGLAFVGDLLMQPSSSLRIDIGGPQGGVDHDLLLATDGPTQLSGSLEVDVLVDGDSVFQPSVGDAFTVLLADDGISGTFANEPKSQAPGGTYQWEVLYGQTSVTLVVAEFIACPADLDGDGKVSPTDMAILLGAWGACDGCLADLDDDGLVGASDLAILLGSWGGCP